jgi:anti-sigma B factor antagonist
MKLTQEIRPDGVYRLALEGPLDIAGSAHVDLPFADAAQKQSKIVVDLSGVDFLASIGVRVLVKTAKAVAERGGRMATYGAQEAPRKVFESTGTDKIVMLVADEDAALAYVTR